MPSESRDPEDSPRFSPIARTRSDIRVVDEPKEAERLEAAMNELRWWRTEAGRMVMLLERVAALHEIPPDIETDARALLSRIKVLRPGS